MHAQQEEEPGNVRQTQNARMEARRLKALLDAEADRQKIDAYEREPNPISQDTLNRAEHLAIDTDEEKKVMEKQLSLAPGVYMTTRKDQYRLGKYYEILMIAASPKKQGERMRPFNSKLKKQLLQNAGFFQVDDTKALFVHIIKNVLKEQVNFFMSELIFLCMFDDGLAEEVAHVMNFVQYGGEEKIIQKQWNHRQAQQKAGRFLKALMCICDRGGSDKVRIVFMEPGGAWRPNMGNALAMPMPITPKFETFLVAIQLHFPNLRVENSIGVPDVCGSASDEVISDLEETTDVVTLQDL